jgi:S-DNA-T family DNA segregation ATPase FtsK/SpoIIIE
MPKKKKQTSEEQEDFQPEPTEKTGAKNWMRDERTHKIIGFILLFFAFYLFLSFTSYLFTWKDDQDKVLKGATRFLFDMNLEVANLLGRLGAWSAHLFFYASFGVASYLFCTFFFVLGINLLFGRPVFSLSKNIKYVLSGLLIFPVFFSFFLSSYAFPWGGTIGNYAEAWLHSFVGTAGTAIILIIALMSYIIWRFNPVFKWPEKKQVPVSETPETSAGLAVIMTPSDEVEKEKEGNTLMNTTPAPLVNQTSSENDVLNQFTLTEKEQPEPVIEDELSSSEEEEPVLVEEEQPVGGAGLQPIATITHTPNPGSISEEDLTLEIKTVPDELPKSAPESAATIGKIGTLYDPFLDLKDYKFPTLDLLENHGSEKIVQDPTELENYKNQILNTLRNYDIEIQKISATVGPTVTLYEIVPAAGVRISRIKNLEDDIALSLAALGIRIIAPIPGKGTIGIEVPNVKKTVVSMKTLLASEKFQKSTHALPIAIGKRIDNENFIVDLATMPHLLMAGATGQGKSVGLNAILVSLLYKKHPSQLKFVLVDPKKVELSLYRHIEHHFLAKLPGEEDAIITDTKKVIHTLNALCIEMDNRYDLLKEAGCRQLREYNEKFVARKLNPQNGHQYLPFIVLVIDEFADLIMTAGKEVETPIARLAQLARAVGIHLIIATQRPSVNIITGTIKANFPARIAFKVSSKVDSRTILDTGGAEQLIGKGDMLISYNGELTRLQCAFVDTPEVDDIVSFISDQRGYPQAFLLPEYVDEKEMDSKEFDVNSKDPLFADAARLIVQNQVGSTSLLQRRMKLGYNRAGRLMDQLEAAGVVGKSQGSKARDVLVKSEAELDQLLSGFE